MYSLKSIMSLIVGSKNPSQGSPVLTNGDRRDVFFLSPSHMNTGFSCSPFNTTFYVWCSGLIQFTWNGQLNVLRRHMSKQYCMTGPRREKTCLRRCNNNKGKDQPVRPRSLISTFIVRVLESIISKLALS